jgi:hypothetical protein
MYFLAFLNSPIHLFCLFDLLLANQTWLKYYVTVMLFNQLLSFIYVAKIISLRLMSYSVKIHVKELKYFRCKTEGNGLFFMRRVGLCVGKPKCYLCGWLKLFLKCALEKKKTQKRCFWVECLIVHLSLSLYVYFCLHICCVVVVLGLTIIYVIWKNPIFPNANI